ncbi:MAG: TspO/MBR family protein [Acidimicrobiales bacterium]
MTSISHLHAGPDPEARPWLALAGFVALCEAAGLVGVPFNQRSIDTWYARLRKPSFNPPNWVFGPVWTVLYLLMGVAAWLVWRSNGGRRRTSMILFGLQLVLNAIWSPLFFGARRPAWALGEMGGLWVAVALTAARFWSVDKRAGGLFVPYLAWVSFAAALNAEIVRLNRGK